MSDEGAGGDESRIPMDPFFHSMETSRAFSECSRCGHGLGGNGEGESSEYLIYKVYGKRDLSMEFAICRRCCLDAQEVTSAESKAAIEKYFNESLMLGYIRRLARRPGGGGFDLESAIGGCSCCGDDLTRPGDEHTIVARCQGSTMETTIFPLVMCEACEKEVDGLLSEKTRDEWDRFMGELVNDPVPGNEMELPQKPKRPRILV